MGALLRLALGLVLALALAACGARRPPQAGTLAPFAGPAPVSARLDLPPIPPDAFLFAAGGRLLLGSPAWDAPVDLSGERCKSAGIYARWSGDGRFIALVCQGARAASLHLIDVVTGEVRAVSAASGLDAAWSPVGHTLAVAEWAGEGLDERHRAYLVDGATGARTELPAAPRYRGGGAMGSGRTTILGTYLAFFTWSPTGEALAITAPNRLYVVDVAAGAWRALDAASDPALYADATWSDGGEFSFEAWWSADGGTIKVERLVRRASITPSGSYGWHAAYVDVTSGAASLSDPGYRAAPRPSSAVGATLPAKVLIAARSPDGRARAVMADGAVPGYAFAVVDATGRELLPPQAFDVWLGWRP